MTADRSAKQDLITSGEPLEVRYRNITDLKPYERNPRTHSKKQLRQIADSIEEFGFTNPVLIDGEDRIIAGHGRVEAGRLLGLASVPTIRLEDMSEAQRRTYIIADNKLAENAGWDPELLANELQFLLDEEVAFDVTLTGFDMPEIDLLLEGSEDPADEADAVPAMPKATDVITRPGDVWCLGPHRLICGNALEAEPYEKLLQGERAQMVFTDPPYNVPIQGHVSGLGKRRHEEFAMASGEMSEGEFQVFLETALGHLADNAVNGSIHFICMDWRHLGELGAAGRKAYQELKNLCVWNKDNGGMGSLYRSKHELVFVYKKGRAPHVNNVQLGCHGRNRTNVWDYPGVSSLHDGRAEALAMHPTVKPVALVADAMRDCSHRGGLVLDAFAGSGTTLVAAEQVGRRARCMELAPGYVDVSVRRWQDLTGRSAVLEATGGTFEETAVARQASHDREDAGMPDQVREGGCDV